jgi:hypothetical protein
MVNIISGRIGVMDDQGDSIQVNDDGRLLVHIESTAEGYGQEGTIELPSDTDTIEIVFGDAMDSADYAITLGVENATDAIPSYYGWLITTVTSGGFVANLSGPTDTSNYVLHWRTGVTIVEGTTIDGVQIHNTLYGLTEDDHPQYYNYARLTDWWSTVSGGGGTTASGLTNPLNGDMSLNGYSIDYGDVLTVNGSFSGETMNVTVGDAGTVFSSVLYMAAGFSYSRADADFSTMASVYAMALEAGAGTKKVLIRGMICNTAWNWTVGDVYLNTIIGTLTQTKPTGSGDQIVNCGWALSADTIFFMPNLLQIEI